MRAVLRWVFPVVAIALAAVLVVPALFGLQRYVITSGSMTGTYDTGSLVYSKPVPVTEIQAGDVITFQPPAATKLVTHRVVSVAQAPDGRPAMRTKGDHNDVVDPWTVTPNDSTLPRATASLPYVGFAVGALDMPLVRLLAIAFPALLLAVALIHGIWRDERAPRHQEVVA